MLTNPSAPTKPDPPSIYMNDGSAQGVDLPLPGLHIQHLPEISDPLGGEDVVVVDDVDGECGVGDDGVGVECHFNHEINGYSNSDEYTSSSASSSSSFEGEVDVNEKITTDETEDTNVVLYYSVITSVGWLVFIIIGVFVFMIYGAREGSPESGLIFISVSGFGAMLTQFCVFYIHITDLQFGSGEKYNKKN